MDTRDHQALIRQWLPQAHTMQLATVKDSQPWSCSVYYAHDNDLRLFWVSTPGRRHSRELKAHGKVSAAIPIRFQQDQRVVGIQVEGDAFRVKNSVDLEHGLRIYDEKFKHDPTFVPDFLAGSRQHKLYCLVPRLIVLFDEQTFASDARKEWRP